MGQIKDIYRLPENDIIVMAYNDGFFVTDDGKLMSPTGKQRTVKCYGKQKYPTFTPWKGSYGISVHKFAAYCFFGKESFRKGIVVRHINGNTEDISKTNIKIGTSRDNALDKHPTIRSAAASVARNASLSAPGGSKLSADKAKEIRTKYATGMCLQRELAEEYDVTVPTISLVVNNYIYPGS